jgi:hypothetical protein
MTYYRLTEGLQGLLVPILDKRIAAPGADVGEPGKKITKREALLRALVAKEVTGNPAAVKIVLDFYAEHAWHEELERQKFEEIDRRIARARAAEEQKR